MNGLTNLKLQQSIEQLISFWVWAIVSEKNVNICLSWNGMSLMNILNWYIFVTEQVQYFSLLVKHGNTKGNFMFDLTLEKP